MQITFDTINITDDEIRGISALLYTVRPAAFDPGPFDAERVAQAVEEKIASGGYVHTKEKLADKGWVAGPSDTVATLRTEPVEETVEERIAEFEKVTGFTALTVDSTGLPWHPDIHASSKALNADGTWRTKRGVDKALVAEVEAELRSRTTVTREIAETGVDEEGFVTIETVGEPVVTVAPPAPPAPEAPPAPLAPVAASETEAPTPPATSTQAASTTPVSPFVALMKRVTTSQGAGKLTQPRVKELLGSLEKKSIMDLRTDEDALASFAVILTAELNGTLAEVAEACGGLKPENIKSILAILPGEGV